MPLYDYKCSCGKVREVFYKIADSDKSVLCQCGAVMAKLPSMAYVRADYAGYNCPVTGKWVEGKVAHNDNLARQGCRVLEPGEKEMNQRTRAAAKASFDASIGEEVEKQLAQMPADSLATLAQGVSNGLDVTIERN